MQYKIVSLNVKNFKCFDNKKFYEFKIDYDKNPVILSGPNGFGKTTFFDAIELLFSKKITRFDSSIEKKTTNLGKNILLNRADSDGYIVLTLKNEVDEYLSLFAKIQKGMHKINVESSVLFGYAPQNIIFDQLEKFLDDYPESKWSESPEFTDVINFRNENFNVYYYISQADSVHFLKRTISDRKDAMNVLLNTYKINECQAQIETLIGKKSNSSNCIVNDTITGIRSKIDQKVEEIKREREYYSSLEETVSPKIELGLFSNNNKLFEWDCPDIEHAEASVLLKYKEQLLSLISFLNNEQDYNNYVLNKEIQGLINNNVADDYSRFKNYIEDDKINVSLINKRVEQIERLNDILCYSAFFRADDVDVSLYNEDHIVKLLKLIPELNKSEISRISELVQDIKRLNSILSTNQIIINKLIEARKKLQISHDNYDSNSTICPFCGTAFDSKELLEKGFAEFDKMLKSSIGEGNDQIELKKEKLRSASLNSREIILSKISGLNDENVPKLTAEKNELKLFANNTGRLENVRKIAAYLKDYSPENDKDIHSNTVEINNILSNKIKKISSNRFDEERVKYKYDEVQEKYLPHLANMRIHYLDGKLLCRLKYIESLLKQNGNTKLLNLKIELYELVKKKKYLEKLRESLVSLGKVYDNSLEAYKNMTLKKLRVPLLIYTGKILQDYQNGLGVFINKDEMRFVSNGDARHDILNTFSSGQLSGFVLSFLFAMNKRFIKESEDDIGFILVDDPVQTMDDINISSLIEVLRTDFKDKQIIISTHETDKENYILYKFFKHNQIGQSLNVKKELYDV